MTAFYILKNTGTSWMIQMFLCILFYDYIKWLYILYYDYIANFPHVGVINVGSYLIIHFVIPSYFPFTFLLLKIIILALVVFNDHITFHPISVWVYLFDIVFICNCDARLINTTNITLWSSSQDFRSVEDLREMCIREMCIINIRWSRSKRSILMTRIL